MAAPRALDLSVTLDAAQQAWSAELRRRVDGGTLSPQTLRNYVNYSARAVTHLGPSRTCDSVEAAEISACLAAAREMLHCGRPVGPAAVVAWHKAVKGLMRYAYEQRWLREDPMRDVPAPPKPPAHSTRPERRALSRQELDAMIAAAQTGRGSYLGDRGTWLRDEIVLRLAGESGLRNADIRNLDLTDIETAPGGAWVAQIRCGKGRKARTAPLTDACAKAIVDYVDHHRPVPDARPDRIDHHGALHKGDAQALLLTAGRRRLNSGAVGLIVRQCAKHALGRHYVPHGLRHTTGTLLAREAKADPALIAHVLGHSDIAVTSVYLDTTEDEAAAAVNRRRVGMRSKAPAVPPPGPDDPRWPECGTREGWNRHRREKGPKCTPCRMWYREAAKEAELRRLQRELAKRDRVIAEQAARLARPLHGSVTA